MEWFLQQNDPLKHVEHMIFPWNRDHDCTVTRILNFVCEKPGDHNDTDWTVHGMDPLFSPSRHAADRSADLTFSTPSGHIRKNFDPRDRPYTADAGHEISQIGQSALPVCFKGCCCVMTRSFC